MLYRRDPVDFFSLLIFPHLYVSGSFLYLFIPLKVPLDQFQHEVSLAFRALPADIPSPEVKRQAGF